MLTGNSMVIPLEPRPSGAVIPLTPAQLALWNYAAKYERRSDCRLSLASRRIFGPIDTGILNFSLDALTERHESLRVRVVEHMGVPQLHVDPPCRTYLEIAYFENVRARDRAVAEQRIAGDFKRRKVDLSAGPLFEAMLVKLSSNEHILLLMLDHIVSDAVSCDILSAELWDLYDGVVHGIPASLTPLTVQFPDYLVWRKRVWDEFAQTHDCSLVGRAAQTMPLELPLDVSAASASLVYVEQCSTDLSQRLGAIARNSRSLLSLVVLSLFLAVLCRWCGRSEIAVAMVAHGRHSRPELLGMIGYLAGFLNFNIQLDRSECFMDLLKKVTAKFSSSLEHYNCDVCSTSASLQSPNVVFNWLSKAMPSHRKKASLHNSPIILRDFAVDNVEGEVNSAAPQLAMGGFLDGRNEVVIYLRYRSDLFRAATIDKLYRNLRELAAEVAEHPNAPIDGFISVT